MATLDKSKIDSRREVPFKINLKGIYEAYQKIFFDAPVDCFDWLTRNTERLSKKMMSGFASVVTVPLGIMTRNAATVANQTINDKDKQFSWVGNLGAVAGAGAAWWVAGSTLFAQMGLAASLGKIGGVVVATVLTAPVLAPALAIGVIAAGTAMGIGTFVISTLPAVANLKIGLIRTLDSLRGIKYDKETMDALQESLNEDSISYNYDERRFHDARSSVRVLNQEAQEKIYIELKEKFDESAAKQTADPAASSQKKKNYKGPSA
jgi:hypothetical protein